MEPARFIENYREAFGPEAPLPIAFWYSDTPIAQTPKTAHCFFREVIPAVRAGHPASLGADNISCGGGRFYTGFAPLRPTTPDFVSTTERYKATPEMVLDHIARSEVPVATKRWLNLARIDKLEGLGGNNGARNFDGAAGAAGADSHAGDGADGANDWNGAKGWGEIEGIIFFATPDILAGLAAWAWFDNNDPGAVTTRFGSGCSTIITDPLRENRRQAGSHRVRLNGRGAKEENEPSEVDRSGGRRTFIGCLDVSVRPCLAPDELSFAVPMSRFREMLATMRSTSLFARHAWPKVRERIVAGSEQGDR